MSLISWLEEHMLSCPYSKYFDIECFGCGMQRSVIALLKGNFVESFFFYPALVPMLFLIGLLIAHLVFKFKHGAAWLKYNFFFVVSIVVINFLLKLIY
ncbi:MAG: DUF2752 domain-containing protein [Vicingaceae bacterium]